jgi:PAS domain S-box-containing protein
MVWLTLLAVVTCLTIVVRRLLRRQNPLLDELYSKRIAIDHVSSGVAWVPAGGKLGSVNLSLANLLGARPEQLAGRNWLEMFPAGERARVEEAYSQMLLLGRAVVETMTEDAHGVATARSVLLVAVHDNQTRLMGHQCIVERVVYQVSYGRDPQGADSAESRVEFANLSS